MRELSRVAAGLSMYSTIPLYFACDSKTNSASQVDTLTASADTTAKSENNKSLFFRISLAEWSVHKTIQSGKLAHLDFPQTARNVYGIEAVEYVDQLFKDKTFDQNYLNE